MRKKILPAKSIVPIQYWQHKSGAHVYLVERSEIPAVNIDILFRAGSSLDGQSHGLSFMTNLMLNQGTKEYDADAIADKFADVGAHFKINSGRDSGGVGLKCLSEKKYFDPAFKLFLEILSSVNFPENAFECRQKQTISLLQQHEQIPNSIAKDAFYHALYSGHVYSHPIEGSIKSILSLKRNDVEQFYKHHYVMNNAIIILVGNINRDAAEKRVNQIAEHLTQGEEVPMVERAVPLKNCQDVDIPFPSEQATVWMGHLGMSFQDPDYYAMRIGNDILGGESTISRLFTQVRGKHGLVYGIGSSFQFSNATGPFIIHFSSKNSTVKKALSLTRSILHDYINKGPTQKEFLAAKQKINNEFPLSLATNNDIINYLIKIGFYKLPIDYIDTYQANIANVSLAQVKAALKKHIKPDEMIKVVVGP